MPMHHLMTLPAGTDGSSPDVGGGGGGGGGGVRPLGSVAAAGPKLAMAPDSAYRLRQIVDDHATFVARVLRNAGIPHADVDDEVQRAFIIVAKRLDDIRPCAEKSFLVQTALNLAAHARRTAARRREVRADEAPELIDMLATPEQLADQRHARRLLDVVLDQMDTRLRTVFVLYEFEELNMAEIAVALGIPAGTVASRLRRARIDFRERAGALAGAFRTEGEP